MYEVRTLKKKSWQIKKFIKLEFQFYKGDENWVPPLKGDTQKILKGTGNPLFANGEHAFFMVFKNRKPVGRVLVGIDEELNRVRGFKQGFFSMFECIDDMKACRALFDASLNWLKEKGMDTVIGPLSPSNGDDRKGLVVMGKGQPVLLNAYTKEYYPNLVEQYGFQKNGDHFAYLFNPEEFDSEKFRKTVEFAKKKGGFRIDKLDAKDIENEARDIKHILDNSVPEEWDYLVAPSLKSVIDEFKGLMPFYDGHYCYIARKGEMPIGFMIALPDYNQVLKRMKGSVIPVGWAKFLYYKRRITGARALVQMVDRNYHRLGVNFAMYFEMYKDWQETKLKFIEASCIDETNTASRLSVEHAGGRHYRTYRTYRYNIR